MNIVIAIITSALLLSTSIRASETDPFKVEGQVWLVKTSGTWKKEKEFGYYRVIVTRNAGEHSRDQAYVQILNNKLEILKTVKLDTPGYKGYVKNVSFNNIGNVKIAISFEIEMKGMYGTTQMEIFVLNSEGVVETVVESKWQDL